MGVFSPLSILLWTASVLSFVVVVVQLIHFVALIQFYFNDGEETNEHQTLTTWKHDLAAAAQTFLWSPRALLPGKAQDNRRRDNTILRHSCLFVHVTELSIASKDVTTV